MCIEFIDEMTWCLGFAFTNYSNLRRMLGEDSWNEMSQMSTVIEWLGRGYLGCIIGFTPFFFFYLFENVYDKRSFEGEKEERNRRLIPTKPCARPFLSIILAYKSSGSCPTSLFHCLKWGRGETAFNTLEINRVGDKREPLTPEDHRDASWSQGKSLQYPLAEKCQNKHVSIYIPPITCYLPLQQSQDFHLRSASEKENKMFQILRDVCWDKRKP